MSAKINLRSKAGGSVGIVVDDTLTTDEEFNLSSGNITYGGDADNGFTKYPDGRLVIWRTSTTTSTITIGSGSIFYNTHGGITITGASVGCDVDFIAVPYCEFGIKHISGITWATGSPVANTTTTAYGRLLSAVYGSKANLRVKATGRWK